MESAQILLVVLAGALVLLNGFFVAAEFAIVKVRRTQLDIRIRRGDRRAKVAGHVVDHLDAYLSATQLGITLASLGLGWIGEPAIAHLIEGPLSRMGIGDEAAVSAVSFVIAFSIITILHIVVGELAPKSLAIQRAERVTLWTAGPLRLFYRIFKPFIWALNGLANLMLRGFGVRPASEHEVVQSEEELRLILAEAGTSRRMDKQRVDIILRTFQLKELEARDIMTPRMRIDTLDASRPFEETLAKAEESGYTRFPLIDKDVDRVLGIIHYRDLVRLARSPAAKKDLSAVKRPVLAAPPTRLVSDLMRDMIQRGIHMTIVVDEHGSTSGLVTLEDIFEELFGEIRDEFDVETETRFREVGEGHWVVDASMPLHEASRMLRLPLEGHDVTTLGGYVTAELGRIPNKGERVTLGPYLVTVREADRRRVLSLDVQKQHVGDAA